MLQESFLQRDIETKGNHIYLTGFPVNNFFRDVHKIYGKQVLNLFVNTYKIFGRGTIITHKFFLPELIYLFSKIPKREAYVTFTNLILEKTWMKNTLLPSKKRVNFSRINSDMVYNLKAYQTEFINKYDEMKQKYLLDGYLLGFEQGLGKTFTALALCEGLQKDGIIIIAPKSILRTVWANEIQNIFKDKQDIWVVGESPKNARFFILNYESIEKIKVVLPFLLQKKNTAIIVDESHNFRNMSAQRVVRLLAIKKIIKSEDILLLSGTPIKGYGGELIPTLKMLDSFFDSEAEQGFIKAFGINKQIGLDILHNRLGLVMHRKMKHEVLNLPEKSYQELKIKIPNSNKYELEYVKKQVLEYIKERKIFYEKEFEKYLNDYNIAIEYLTKTLKDDRDFQKYLLIIKQLRKHGYSTYDRQQVHLVKWANDYEKNVLQPLLPSDLKKKFVYAKSVVKYVDLKIMGEVIGGLLNKLRANMFSDMIQNSNLCEIIKNSEKKTVCFTTFVDVVKNAEIHAQRTCKQQPITIYGETTKNVRPLLQQFKTDLNANPLIATIQTLSTGVTLIEANTVVFLNQPWRFVDRSQAEDRVHRIGQDTKVMIYTFVLDTPGPNLSTRMEDIVSWSKQMFTDIVGVEPEKVNKTLSRLVK